MNDTSYQKLLECQGVQLRDLDIRKIIDSISEMVANDSYDDVINSLPIDIRNDNDRSAVPVLSFDYDMEEEKLMVSTQYGTNDYYAGRNGFNYNAIERRIRNVVREYGDLPVYIDTVDEPEYEMPEEPDYMDYEENLFSGSAYESAETEQEEPDMPEVSEEMININRQRTQLDEKYPINLNKIANALREQGYTVVQRNKTSFAVMDKDLSSDNSITFTSKNAYIERASISSDKEKELYDKMKDAVEREMQKNIEKEKMRAELIESSPSIAGNPIQSVTNLMMDSLTKEADKENTDLSDVFASPKKEYVFLDDQGKEYMSISCGYTVGEDKGLDSQVKSEITVRYGEEYGDVSKTFQVSEQDMQDFKDGDFEKNDLNKNINEFISVGIDGIGTHFITDEEKNAFMNNMKCVVYEDGKEVITSEEKEPFTCDREWLQKLGRLEDKLVELRNGPVQNMIDHAAAIGKSLNEARKGVISVYQDGVLSGFEIGNGVSSFKEGWNYGTILSAMEKNYERLSASNKEEDRIAAINQKVDIKFYRDSVRNNADIYVRSAMSIKNQIDKLIDKIHDFKAELAAGHEAKAKGIVLQDIMSQAKDTFAKVGDHVVNDYKKMVSATHEVNRAFRMMGTKAIGVGKNALDFAYNGTISQINEFKDKYNDIVVDAKVVLSQKEYSINRIAERMNDARADRIFSDVDSKNIAMLSKNYYWDELENAVKAGRTAAKIPVSERTRDDMIAIENGEKAAKRKEQNTFIAEKLNKEVKCILKNESIDVNEAVNRLAKEYHNAAMSYNMLNGAVSVKSYEDLSASEKEMCRDIVADVMRDMPAFVGKLNRNFEKAVENERDDSLGDDR